MLRWLFALNVALAVGQIVVFAQLAVQGAFWRADFSCFYMGWQLARQQPEELYEVVAQREATRTLLAPYSQSPHINVFNYPPHSVVLFAPLSWLPLETSFYLWAAVQLLLLGWLLFRARQMQPDQQRARHLFVLVAILASSPWLATLQLGALSTLVAAGVGLAIAGEKNCQPLAAGLGLALATVKPHLVVYLFLYFLAARRWRTLGTATAVLLAWGLLTIVWPGWPAWTGWVRLLSQGGSAADSFGGDPAHMFNLRGPLAAWLPASGVSSVAAWLGFAAGACGTLVWGWQTRRPDPLRAALVQIANVLLCPHLFKQDWLTLVVPLVVLAFAGATPRPRLWLLLGATPLLLLLDQSWSDGKTLGIPAVILVICGWAGWLTARQQNGEKYACRPTPVV